MIFITLWPAQDPMWVCSTHKTKVAAKKARACEKRGGAKHVIVTPVELIDKLGSGD